MTMITPSYLGETIEYSSLHACRSTLEDPTAKAEIAWQDKRGNMGIRFVKLAPQQHRTLQLWLAQQYFAN